MEKAQLAAFEARCIQEEAPYCRAACPIHVDARGLAATWADRGPGPARAVLERTMPLPALTAHMCEAPCLDHCLRGELGGSIAIGELERAAVDQKPRQAKLLRMPPKKGKVVILGSGAAGLAAAWDLAKKGWRVSLGFGQTQLGGALEIYARQAPPKALTDELAALEFLGAQILPGLKIDARLLEEVAAQHDAVLVCDEVLASGALDLDPAAADPCTLRLGESNRFVAGFSARSVAPRFIDDLAQGRRAATSLDRLLQGVSLTANRQGEGPQPTRLETATTGLSPVSPVMPADPTKGYTEVEARTEGGRCLRCDCMQCVRACAYLEQYGGFPRVYARQIYNNEAIVKGSRDANTLINSCSLCGQCTEICPHDFSMAQLCLEARQRMVDLGRMPGSAHHFALAEMEAAWSPQASLARHAPDAATSAWLFFPGCQLGGLRPDQVRGIYDHLRGALEGGVGLMLACCGAPAHWSGHRMLFQEVLERIRQAWRDLDCPRVITACSSCLAMFRDHLPELAPISLWELWQTHGAPPLAAPREGLPPVVISDPCTSRHDTGNQQAVRGLLAQAGQAIQELEMSGALTECCGYGGLMDTANPALGEKVIRRRSTQSDLDFLTYCAMCRQRLAQVGTRALHVLDLYFPPPDQSDPAAEPALGLSARWEKRAALKAQLDRELWDQAPEEAPAWAGVRLTMSDEVAAVLEQRRILRDDLRQVLHRDDAPARFQDRATGRRLASRRLGPVTYWVEYEPEDDGYRVHRAWSHRMVVGRAKS